MNTITHSDVEVTITTTVSDDTSASEPTDSDSESDQDQSTEDEEPDDGKKSSSDSENAGEAEEGPRVLTVTSVQMEDDTGTAEAANQDVNYQSGASKRKGSFWIVFAGCAVTVTISVLWDIR